MKLNSPKTACFTPEDASSDSHPMAGVAKATLDAAMRIEAPVAATAAVAPASSLRFTPNEDSWKDPEGWALVLAHAGQRLVESGEKSSFDRSREVTDIEWSHHHRSSSGQFVSRDRWRNIGRALNVLLRHDRWIRIRVILLGFAWVDDVLVILEKWGILAR